MIQQYYISIFQKILKTEKQIRNESRFILRMK